MSAHDEIAKWLPREEESTARQKLRELVDANNDAFDALLAAQGIFDAMPSTSQGEAWTEARSKIVQALARLYETSNGVGKNPTRCRHCGLEGPTRCWCGQYDDPPSGASNQESEPKERA